MKHSSIYEVLDYGSIVAHDEEFGLLITANPSYLNMWVARGEHEWENVDCQANQEERDLNQLKKKAEKWLSEVMTDDQTDYEEKR